jgi:predicted nuclease of predicted toxin-antitoxin system
MAGRGIRLFTDEMIDPVLATELCQRGYDALSCHGAGRANQRIPDEDQLTYATAQGRAILTYNAVDFMPLAQQWQNAGRAHAGIIVSSAMADVGEALRRVIYHLDTYDPAVQQNCVLWLQPVP